MLLLFLGKIGVKKSAQENKDVLSTDSTQQKISLEK
jgi:hypothetical protein